MLICCKSSVSCTWYSNLNHYNEKIKGTASHLHTQQSVTETPVTGIPIGQFEQRWKNNWETVNLLSGRGLIVQCSPWTWQQARVRFCLPKTFCKQHLMRLFLKWAHVQDRSSFILTVIEHGSQWGDLQCSEMMTSLLPLHGRRPFEAFRLR